MECSALSDHARPAIQLSGLTASSWQSFATLLLQSLTAGAWGHQWLGFFFDFPPRKPQGTYKDMATAFIYQKKLAFSWAL